MKKLMFAASAALCAAVGFADVTSANVVGYAQATARFGTKILGAQFGTIDGKEIDIQDLRPVGPYDDVYEDGGVYMQRLNENGVDIATYTFYKNPAITTGRPKPARDGWYDPNDEFTKIVGETIKPGEGLYFTAPSAEWSLQSAGQVLTSNVVVTLRFGTKMVVNPLPVPVDIQDIKIAAGFDGDVYEDAGVYMQVLNLNGVDIATYAFYKNPAITVGRPKPARDGWYDANDEFTPGEYTIQPGEGVMFTAPDSTWKIQFPGVVLDK